MAGNTVSPFDGLPSISFTNSDVTALQSALITGIQNAWNAATGENLNLTLADRRTNFAFSFLGVLVQVLELIDASAKQNLLPFATGGFLDNLAAFFGSRAARLAASPATTTLQFTLPIAVSGGSPIPSGTQVSSSSSNLIFATTEVLTIPGGSLSGTVTANCTTTGVAGNYLAVGDIVTLEGWTGSFTPTVTNTEETAGGADIESDTAYRIRLFNVTDSYSNAGSYGAYQFFAESADASISSVSVVGPETGLVTPGQVLITVLCQNGVFPNSAVLSNVYNAVNADNIRPLTDQVFVQAPSGVPYSVQVNYWVDNSQSNNVVNIQANVDTAVNNWITNNYLQLGGSINPNTLINAINNAGASYVQVVSPVHTLLNNTQVALLVNDPIVSYQGLESDLSGNIV